MAHRFRDSAAAASLSSLRDILECRADVPSRVRYSALILRQLCSMRTRRSMNGRLVSCMINGTYMPISPNTVVNQQA
ncbi:hypothetical protein BD310DRAFT_939762 [Dichomitus squalens]|uniref:Uncharacterized protein n=1 Tax=Dichomitus squalens TaxID=114155 RepID=A0A4Q9PHW0_9APHY|nr:hypothetical protein BD310DRAFT_939762 [Dichomitus squalens]